MAQFIARRLGPKAVQVLDSNLVAGLPNARNASLLARGQGGWRTVAPRAGLARGAGVVGGLASTGMGIANLAGQGNPVDAFEEGAPSTPPTGPRRCSVRPRPPCSWRPPRSPRPPRW